MRLKLYKKASTIAENATENLQFQPAGVVLEDSLVFQHHVTEVLSSIVCPPASKDAFISCLLFKNLTVVALSSHHRNNTAAVASAECTKYTQLHMLATQKIMNISFPSKYICSSYLTI